MSRRTALCALLVGSSALVTSSASADEAADTAAARVLAGDGITLADAGDCQQAIDKLRRAEDLHHAATTAGRLGECEIAIGHLVVGSERIQRLLREPVAPNAPAVFVDSLARARRVLDRTLPRIATLRVSATVPAGTRLQMTVDGERLPEALLDNERPLDPGRHTVVARAQGFLTKTEDVTVRDGEKATLAVELSPDPAAQAAAQHEVEAAAAHPASKNMSTSEANPGAAPAASSSSGMHAASVVSFSVGGAGVLVGAIGGAIVASYSSDLSKSCGPDKVCPPAKQSELSSAKTWATVSTVGFAVAGAGAGVGLLLLLLGKHDESAGATTAKIRPVVGPLYVGCEGVL